MPRQVLFWKRGSENIKGPPSDQETLCCVRWNRKQWEPWWRSRPRLKARPCWPSVLTIKEKERNNWIEPQRNTEGEESGCMFCGSETISHLGFFMLYKDLAFEIIVRMIIRAAIYWGPVITGHHAQCFPCVSLFHSHKDSPRAVLLAVFFCSWGNQGTEKLSNLPEAIRASGQTVVPLATDLTILPRLPSSLQLGACWWLQGYPSLWVCNESWGPFLCSWS